MIFALKFRPVINFELIFTHVEFEVCHHSFTYVYPVVPSPFIKRDYSFRTELSWHFVENQWTINLRLSTDF